MKATLTFDLDDVDDREKHLLMLKSSNMNCLLIEWEGFLREQRKYIELSKENADYLELLTRQYYELKKAWLSDDE